MSGWQVGLLVYAAVVLVYAATIIHRSRMVQDYVADYRTRPVLASVIMATTCLLIYAVLLCGWWVVTLRAEYRRRRYGE